MVKHSVFEILGGNAWYPNIEYGLKKKPVKWNVYNNSAAAVKKPDEVRFKELQETNPDPKNFTASKFSLKNFDTEPENLNFGSKMAGLTLKDMDGGNGDSRDEVDSLGYMSP